jgi:hypothetical protein
MAELRRTAGNLHEVSEQKPGLRQQPKHGVCNEIPGSHIAKYFKYQFLDKIHKLIVKEIVQNIKRAAIL